MRNIHVVRVEGLDIETLTEIFDKKFNAILNAHPRKPEKHRDFNNFANNCATVVREGLIEYGFDKLTGNAPRDMLFSCAFEFSQNSDLEISVFKKNNCWFLKPRQAGIPLFFSIKNYFKLNNQKTSLSCIL